MKGRDVIWEGIASTVTGIAAADAKKDIDRIAELLGLKSEAPKKGSISEAVGFITTEDSRLKEIILQILEQEQVLCQIGGKVKVFNRKEIAISKSDATLISIKVDKKEIDTRIDIAKELSE